MTIFREANEDKCCLAINKTIPWHFDFNRSPYVMLRKKSKEDSNLKKLILIVFLILLFMYSLLSFVSFRLPFGEQGSAFAFASKFIRSFDQTFTKVWPPAGSAELRAQLLTHSTKKCLCRSPDFNGSGFLIAAVEFTPLHPPALFSRPISR